MLWPWRGFSLLRPFRSSGSPHEHLHMGRGGTPERVEVVAAFQGGDEPALGVLGGGLQELLGGPGVIALDQPELGQWVPDMGVEPGRDQEEVGSEIVESGQDAGLERGAEIFAVIA